MIEWGKERVERVLQHGYVGPRTIFRRYASLTSRCLTAIVTLSQLFDGKLAYFGRSIPSFFILDSNVVGFSPRISAAPPEPRTCQSVCSSTPMIC